MTIYLVCDPDRPHVVLFSARTLDEAAAAIAVQPDPDALVLYGNDGFSRGPHRRRARPTRGGQGALVSARWTWRPTI